MRAVVYVRTAPNDPSDRLVRLWRACRTYCGERGYEVVDEFVDEGCSGLHPDRPAFGSLIAAALDEAPGFDVVVVAAPEQIMVRPRAFAAYSALLRGNGIELVSLLSAAEPWPERERTPSTYTEGLWSYVEALPAGGEKDRLKAALGQALDGMQASA